MRAEGETRFPSVKRKGGGDTETTERWRKKDINSGWTEKRSQRRGQNRWKQRGEGEESRQRQMDGVKTGMGGRGAMLVSGLCR